ncbi:arginine/serine-rich protein PNISR isoform X2 [Cyprinus carpio]|uniref:Arginine/serine-rich protein PNISR isoform X2 n=1 Tax=Cyprinus carpio TaxID=7962 RepID=A0A9R0BAR9_CYPCA|nr:arginine/serine-rich protein PNISR isoform X2 [Cyprinus carpio]XP_042628735.1 arginine/serine-rich protein PNISR isoform X2 [Cyprinus carpio]
MWDQGGQPWPQWPLSSQQQWMQSFQHQQDPGQVDWAALAQAWIAQKESTGGVANQQGIQPNGQEVQHLEPPGHNNHGAFPGDPNFGRGWQPEWGMHGQPPPPPPPEQAWIPPGQGPMDVVNASEDSNSQDSLEFPGDPHHGGFPQNSHGFGGQPEPYPIGPVGVNQFDYQHGAAPTGTAYGPPSTGFHAPYWPEGPQNRRDRLPGFRPERPRSPNQMGIKPETPTLDAVKRRTLPAWIREGLEKMDREKQKKLEKERMEKERAEMANNERASDMVEEEGDGPRMPRKSKFDSDDEDGEEDGAGEDSVSGRRLEFGGRSSPPVQEDQSEPEMTEEEKEFQLMLMTKTLLTEVLLEVTNEEIFQVAKETHRKATKAPAKQLAQSNALASLTGLGGLGEYGSDESEDEERSVKGSDSSDTDDEELLHRIRQKQDAFRRKEKEQQQLQERLALEVQTVKDLASDRVSRERAGYEEEQTESKHKQEVREREAEPTLERRRSRSEPEVSEVKRASKEHTGRNGGSASRSPSERHSRTSSSSSSSSRYSSSSSSSASSRSSSRSSSPRRKRRRSNSASRGTRRRSRSRSSRRRQSERDKGRDRRQSSRARSTDRSSRHRKRSHSRQRRSSRGRRSRSKASRSRSRERRRSRDRRRSRSRSTSRSRRKQKASSKDRDRRKERSRSHEKDKKKKEKDLDKKKDKQKGEGSLVRDEEDDAKSRRKKESERTDSHSERFFRQDSKSSKKGSAKASKKYSDSESSRSRSPSPEVSKEKKSKKSKRSRSRSTERSHKSGKKASRKHKSKSRSSVDPTAV